MGNLQNNPDDLFRKRLENLPEEGPSPAEWQRLRSGLQQEGILPEKDRKKFFLFASLAAGVTVAAAAFFLAPKGSPSLQEEKKAIAVQEMANETSKGEAEDKSAGTGMDKNKAGNQDNRTSENTEAAKKAERLSGADSPADPPSAGETDIRKNAPSVSVPAAEPSAVPEIKPEKIKERNIAGIHPGAGPGDQRRQHSASEKKPAATEAAGKSELPELAATEKKSAYREEKAAGTPASGQQSKQMDPGASSASSPTGSQEISLSAVNSEKQENASPAVHSAAKAPKDSAAQQPPPVVLKKDSAAASSPVRPAGKPSQPAENLSRAWLGGYFSYDRNHYLSKERKTPAGESGYVAQFDPNKTAKNFQFTAGITGGYLLSERVSIDGGIMYSQKKKWKQDISMPMYISQFGESISQFSYYYNAQYLEISGRVKYYFSKGKLNYYLAAGPAGSFNFPVKEEKRGYFTRTFFSEATQPEQEKVILEPSSLGLSALVAAGVEIRLASKWSIYAEPSYRYAFNPVIKRAGYDKVPVQHYWRTAAIGIGCMYHF